MKHKTPHFWLFGAFWGNLVSWVTEIWVQRLGNAYFDVSVGYVSFVSGTAWINARMHRSGLMDKCGHCWRDRISRVSWFVLNISKNVESPNRGSSVSKFAFREMETTWSTVGETKHKKTIDGSCTWSIQFPGLNDVNVAKPCISTVADFGGSFQPGDVRNLWPQLVLQAGVQSYICFKDFLITMITETVLRNWVVPPKTGNLKCNQSIGRHQETFQTSPIPIDPIDPIGHMTNHLNHMLKLYTCGGTKLIIYIYVYNHI